jgi:hypothetical protein
MKFILKYSSSQNYHNYDGQNKNFNINDTFNQLFPNLKVYLLLYLGKNTDIKIKLFKKVSKYQTRY